jgi:TldD protein
MHNKRERHAAGHSLHRQCPGYTYSDEPLIRMRNTIIVPGQDNLADMIASIEDGYYW